MRELHEANRLSWNAATRAHNSHKADQAAFLRSGGSTLFPEELALLGDLGGRTLVHLLCNAGQDTLSLARLGATVTGVDISDEAIAFACRLSEESGIPGTFASADVYDWLDAPSSGGRFDVAFCSYGALCWLSDLRRFVQGMAGVLVPGGRFVCVEFHPLAWIFDEGWRLAFPYATGGRPLRWDDGVRDYVARSGPALAPSGFREGVRDFHNPHPAHEFPWGLADVVGSVLAAGLVLEHLAEYPYANGARLFEDMVEAEGRRMVPPPHVPGIPLMYSLVARRWR